MSAKHGVNSKVGFKSKFGLNLGEENRGEEGKKKKKRKRKRRRREAKIKKVWKLTLSMDSSMDHMDFVWNCMDHMDFLYRYIFVVLGCRKPNPRMSSCMEIITNPFVFLGFCYEKT